MSTSYIHYEQLQYNDYTKFIILMIKKLTLKCLSKFDVVESDADISAGQSLHFALKLPVVSEGL